MIYGGCWTRFYPPRHPSHSEEVIMRKARPLQPDLFASLAAEPGALPTTVRAKVTILLQALMLALVRLPPAGESVTMTAAADE